MELCDTINDRKITWTNRNGYTDGFKEYITQKKGYGNLEYLKNSDGYRWIPNVGNINKNLNVILRRVISGDAYSRAFVFFSLKY